MTPRDDMPPAAEPELPPPGELRRRKPITVAPEDEWVPLRKIAREFNTTLRTVHRWRNDPNLGFPPVHSLNGIGYATRSDLQTFKSRLANGEPPKMRGRR